RHSTGCVDIVQPTALQTIGLWDQGMIQPGVIKILVGSKIKVVTDASLIGDGEIRAGGALRLYAGGDRINLLICVFLIGGVEDCRECIGQPTAQTKAKILQWL